MAVPFQLVFFLYFFLSRKKPVCFLDPVFKPLFPIYCAMSNGKLGARSSFTIEPQTSSRRFFYYSPLAFEFPPIRCIPSLPGG